MQDAIRLQLWGVVRTRDTDVQGLGFWPTPGFQPHSVSRKSLKEIPFWTTLENAVTDSCLGLLWLDRLDLKNAVCQLSTHVGTATTRDEINIKRLLRYLVGNPACNMIVGCNLDVIGIAGTPQGSALVMTDAD